MATLSIDSLDVLGTARPVQYHVFLCDVNGDVISGHTDEGTIVRSLDGWTDDDGHAALDLIPNADITPAPSYYTVQIGVLSFLIEKADTEETLADAIVVDPADVPAAFAFPDLADVADWDDAEEGDVPVFSADGKLRPAPPGEAAAPVDSVNGQTGDVVLTADDVGADPAGTADDAIAAFAALPDPIGVYQLEAQKGQANGYAQLDGSALLPDSIIPSSIARDSEVSAAVAAAVASLIGSAPGTLDTLEEIADALQDNPSVITDLVTSIGSKVAASLYDAQSVLIAISDNNPTALVIPENRVLGRLGANVTVLDGADLRTLIDFSAQVQTIVDASIAALKSELVKVIDHAADPDVARDDDYAMNLWRGTVFPNDMAEAEVWIDSSNA